jgi:hypothetical protein
MRIERRNHRRLRFSTAAYFTADKPSLPLGTVGVAALRDVSAEGLSWSTDILLEVGDFVSLTMEIATVDEPISLQGEVVWVTGDWSGVRLHGYDESYGAALGGLLREPRAPDLLRFLDGATFEPTIRSHSGVRSA